MKNVVGTNFILGMIAGGQLARMLTYVTQQWDIKTAVMDADEHCPAASTASLFFKGDRFNFDDVVRFGQKVDLLTYEIESINIDALIELKNKGRIIHPDPEVLRIVQDKGFQKMFFKKSGIPTSSFRLFENRMEILREIDNGSLSVPFVQKLRTGGYDGRGVLIVTDPDKLNQLFDAPSVVEDMVSIKKELSVIVARSEKGEIKSYPVVEMEFHPEANLVEKVFCPALIDPETERRAEEIAMSTIESLNMTGILAVEMFLDTEGEIRVNEIAPRPHNSGHLTIEGNYTSQFEQHLRAILGLKLGDTKVLRPSVMINLTGDPGHQGPVLYEGIDRVLGIPGVYIHLYGKKETRPFRKMGHITITSDSLEDALKKADKIKSLVRVISWKNH